MQFLFSFPVEPIRNKSSDLLGEQKHSEDDRDRTPEQYVANPSPPNRALFGPVLLPESDPDQHDGKTQKPRTQGGEEKHWQRPPPRAAANPSGRQQPTVATDERIAGNSNRMPRRCAASLLQHPFR